MNDSHYQCLSLATPSTAQSTGTLRFLWRGREQIENGISRILDLQNTPRRHQPNRLRDENTSPTAYSQITRATTQAVCDIQLSHLLIFGFILSTDEPHAAAPDQSGGIVFTSYPATPSQPCLQLAILPTPLANPASESTPSTRARTQPMARSATSGYGS